jgi:hypothetical protein
MIYVIFFFVNLYLKKHHAMTFRIDAVQEEDALSVQMLKEKEYDVLPIYQLAHLSVCYQKFEQYSRSIFEENKRIKEFLPNTPLQTVI